MGVTGRVLGRKIRTGVDVSAVRAHHDAGDHFLVGIPNRNPVDHGVVGGVDHRDRGLDPITVVDSGDHIDALTVRTDGDRGQADRVRRLCGIRPVLLADGNGGDLGVGDGIDHMHGGLNLSTIVIAVA